MVLGKEQLCRTEEYKKHFKSFKGFEKDPNWYARLDSLIKQYVNKEYQDFLAQPVVKDESINWYAKFDRRAERLTELQAEEREKYEQIKNKTLDHYRELIKSLDNDNRKEEAQFLKDAIQYVDDQFIYCFNDKVVLGLWGMQLRDRVREVMGVAVKDLFVKQDAIKPKLGEETIPVEDTPKEIEIGPQKPNETPSYTVRFNSGDKGRPNGASVFQKYQNETISSDEIPYINVEDGYEFTGWDREPQNLPITEDIEFTAQYNLVQPPIPPIPAKLPWYKRFGAWFKEKGCLNWLLWLLLILFLILLFFWLVRSCSDTHNTNLRPIPGDIEDRPWVDTDPNTNKGGIYNPGNPYTPKPTPPEYNKILPPTQGHLPPIDSTQIVREPGNPVIVGNRLNILMENDDKSIMDFAEDFKQKYPEDKYKVVYYDNVVKRMQIEIPSRERTKLKQEIPGKFAPEYELFVFDESLFERRHTPNDPAFGDPNKSWYLHSINAPAAWDIAKGSDQITVAIVDNGFSLNHPELKSKVVMPYNVWTHSSDVFAQKIDHGTHVAGTALAIMDNNLGLCGIAPNAAFMPIQVANGQDLVTLTSVLDGILYALYQGADVINVSLGLEIQGPVSPEEQRNWERNRFKEEERLWHRVMKISQKHNAILVIAAGNDNMLAGIDPLNRPENFIVVSAVDKGNRAVKASFSNYGQYATISAPGVDIYSSVGDNSYNNMSGTSMAAPIVTGAVALMKSLDNTLTAQEIICILKNTGTPVAEGMGNLIQLDEALKAVSDEERANCQTNTPQPSTGDVQVLLSWENYNDLDLICTDPKGEIVWFKNKEVSSGGILEIDMNIGSGQSQNPIENIFWPSGQAPEGEYNVYVLYYKQHDPAVSKTSYKATIKYNGKTEEHSGEMLEEGQRKHIASFTVGSANKTHHSNIDNRKEELQREKTRLEQALDKIDEELRSIKN